jgi:hypothetical protein
MEMGAHGSSFWYGSMSSMVRIENTKRSSATSARSLITSTTLSTFPYFGRLSRAHAQFTTGRTRRTSARMARTAPATYWFSAGWRDCHTGVSYFFRRTNKSAGYTPRTYRIVWIATSTGRCVVSA